MTVWAVIAVVTIHSEIDQPIDRKRVCRFIGYADDAEPSSRIATLLDEYIGNARQLLEPSYSYLIRRIVRVEERRVEVEGSIILEGEVISGLLASCERAAFFALTIGPRLEEMAATLADNAMIIESYVLDAIGSSSTEGLAARVQSEIAGLARAEGTWATPRLSPGHCGWDISQQRVIFDAMGGSLPYLTLTDDYLMLPKKSASGVIGIGVSGTEEAFRHPCSACKSSGCLMRG